MGYNDANGVCTLPTTVVTNAYTYSNATTATSCNEGFQLANNACTAINTTTFANAVSLNSTNTAITACARGYSTFKNTANANTDISCQTTSNANCSVSNCDGCENNNTYDCRYCKSGYNLTMGAQTQASPDTCVQTTVTNCWAGSANACTICLPGYSHSSGACVKGAITVFGKILSLLLVFIL